MYVWLSQVAVKMERRKTIQCGLPPRGKKKAFVVRVKIKSRSAIRLTCWTEQCEELLMQNFGLYSRDKRDWSRLDHQGHWKQLDTLTWSDMQIEIMKLQIIYSTCIIQSPGLKKGF